MRNLCNSTVRVFILLMVLTGLVALGCQQAEKPATSTDTNPAPSQTPVFKAQLEGGIGISCKRELAFRKLTQALHNFDVWDAPSAILHFTASLNLDQDCTLAAVFLSLTHNNLGNLEHAHDALAIAKRSRQINEYEKLWIKNLQAYINHDMQGSLKFTQDILKKHPNDKRALAHQTFLHYKTGEWEKAVKSAEQSYKLDPKYSRALNMLGYLYIMDGQIKKGLPFHEKQVELYPEYPNPHDSLGWAYLQAGRLGDAVKEYEKVLKMRPDFTVTYTTLANALILLGDYKKAEVYINKLLSRKGDEAYHPAAKLSMARKPIFQRDKDATVTAYNDAIAAMLKKNQLKKALEAKTELTRFLAWIGDAEGAAKVANEGKELVSKAGPQFQKLAKLDVGRTVAVAAIASGNKEQMDAAIAAYKKEVGPEPVNVQITILAELACLAAVKTENWAACAKTGEEFGREDAVGNYLLGLSLEKLGKMDEAKKRMEMVKGNNNSEELIFELSLSKPDAEKWLKANAAAPAPAPAEAAPTK